ncbi:MAG: pilin N-terminal domain-containing protein, partial [Vagococcus fluvialis]
MKKTKNLSLLIMSITTLVLGICSILIPGNQVQAAEEGKADIVLHKKQMLKSPSTQIQNTGDVMDEFEKNYQALENMEFKIYDATAEFYDLRANGNKGKGMTSEEAIRRIQSFELSDLAGREPLETRKTDFEGKLTFRVDKEINGKDAVYLIIESDAPNVVEAANLVVAFPVYQMDSDGNYTDIELDTVHLYPKNVISNGGILKITKRVSYDHKETLDGAKFIVSKDVTDKEEEKEVTRTFYISGAKDGIYEWSTDETKAFKFVTGKLYQPGNEQIEE